MAERQLRAISVGILVLGALAFVVVGLTFSDSLPGRLLTGDGLQRGPKQPVCGPAVVDGHDAEWVLADDVFANAHRAGEDEQKVEAKLCLRYDGRTSRMYALFLSAGEWPVLVRRSQVQLAVDSTSEGVALVDFAWVEPGYDGNRQHARGWEASFAATPGEHVLWAGALIVDEGEIREASTPNEGTAMDLACDHTTTLFLRRLQAVPTDGQVRLDWETAWEVNNLGFNVYHSSERDGPWTRLNLDLIRSQAAREDTAGARYEFVHTGVGLEADNYYLLEDVASDGILTRHGPIVP
jgi:hypothetical protein